MPRPIVTITLNPALDLSAEVPKVEPGPKLRTGAVLAEPGGGGINVARAVVNLGGRATALAALGGATGKRLAAQLEQVDGLELVALSAPGETRESLTLRETTSGAEYRFVLPGPEWAAEHAPSLRDAILSHLPAGALVVLSGSQPPGLPADLAQSLARHLPDQGRLVVDISGDSLGHLLAHPDPGAMPAILRLDAAEAAARAGRVLATAQDSAGLAADWVGQGVAGCVILARGSEGSVMVNAQGAWLCAPPEVPVASKVGAGDSFVAGLTLALARDEPQLDALRLGTAAAAAAVMTPGSALCRAEDVARLLRQCRLTRL